MEHSESIKALVAALAKAQSKIVPPKRSQTAEVTMKAGGKFKYTYTELSEVHDAIREPFGENELALIQVPIPDDVYCIVETVLAHSSGEWISGTMKIKPDDSTAQKWGSCMTYIRRYSALAICGLAPEDDDGAAASGHTATNIPTTEHKEPPRGAQGPPVVSRTDSVAQQQADAKAHWCSTHNTEYFKKGKMAKFSHPIKDKDGKTLSWCDEPKIITPAAPVDDTEKRKTILAAVDAKITSLGRDPATEKQAKFSNWGKQKPSTEELVSWLADLEAVEFDKQFPAGANK